MHLDKIFTITKIFGRYLAICAPECTIDTPQRESIIFYKLQFIIRS